MRRLLPPATLAVVLLLAVSRDAAGQWVYATSDHFEVYTTAGERRAKETLEYFERVHGFFTEFLRLSPTQPRPTRLIVFSNEKEFAPYRMNEVATAYYRPGPDRDYIVMGSQNGTETYPLVIHEYTHLIIRHSGSRFPLWLDEGLAEFFSTLSPAPGNKVALGRVPMGRLQFLAAANRLLTPDQLFAVEHNSPEYNTKTHAGVFYAESWALTHMLLADERYRSQSDAMLRQIAAGAPSATTIEAVYERPLSAIFRDLQGYIRGGNYMYFLADYRMTKGAADFVTRPATPFEAGLVTANLLAAGRGREKEAEAAFEALARDKPDDLELTESRAMFEIRRNRLKEAAPHLARAVELGSRNPEIYRAHAATLDPTNADAQESSIRRAVELDPDDLDMRLFYARLLMNRRNAAEVIETLTGVKRVPADRAFELFYLAAVASTDLRRFDAARTDAAQASKYARSPAETERVSSLLKAIDDYQTRQAAADRAIRDANSAGSGASAAVSPEPGTPGPAQAGFPSPGSRPLQTVAEGRLRNMVCPAAGQPPVLEVATDAGTLRLLVDRPEQITIQGAGGATIDLTCGAQDRRVRVGYEPEVNAPSNTVGKVRLLDFRQ